MSRYISPYEREQAAWEAELAATSAPVRENVNEALPKEEKAWYNTNNSASTPQNVMRNALSAVDYAFKTAFWHDNEEKQKEAEREYKNTFRTDMSTPKVENLPYTTSEAPKITYLDSSKTTPSVSYEGTNKSKDEWHIDMSPKAQAERSARNIRESAERRNPDNGWLQEKADHEKNRAVQSARIKALENMDYYKYGRHEITDPPSYNPSENMAEIIIKSPEVSAADLKKGVEQLENSGNTGRMYEAIKNLYYSKNEYEYNQNMAAEMEQMKPVFELYENLLDRYNFTEENKELAKKGEVEPAFRRQYSGINAPNDHDEAYAAIGTVHKYIMENLSPELARKITFCMGSFPEGFSWDMRGAIYDIARVYDEVTPDDLIRLNIYPEESRDSEEIEDVCAIINGQYIMSAQNYNLLQAEHDHQMAFSEQRDAFSEMKLTSRVPGIGGFPLDAKEILFEQYVNTFIQPIIEEEIAEIEEENKSVK